MTTVSKKLNLRLTVTQVARLDEQKLKVLGTDLNGTSVTVLLEGVWSQNHIPNNSIVHVINPLIGDETGQIYTVNNSNGFIVIEPDSLLTCTLVASSLFCERKTWLNTIFSGMVGTNRAMLVGTLVHEVFQYGLKNKTADTEKLIKYLDVLLDDATVMLEIYSVELHLKEVRDEAITYISSVKEWIEKFMLTGPMFPLTNDSQIEVKIQEISDIEENVWSTKYGLKGKIDVTGLVRVYDKRTKVCNVKKIPLELKTGNPNLSSSHAAQVSLYSMMIEDRYAETNQGFVIYLKNGAAMHNIALTHNIKRDLIQRRNQINYYMKSYFQGPDMIDSPRLCKGCDRLTECILVSDLYSPGKIDRFSSMKSLEKEAIGHLDDKFKSFFKKYHEKLLSLMTNSNNNNTVMGDTQPKISNSFWTYSSNQAELEGIGFGGLQVVSVKATQSGTIVIFKRHPSHKVAGSVESTISNNNNNNNKESPKKEPPVIDIIELDDEPITKKARIDQFFKPVKKTKEIEIVDEIKQAPPSKRFDTTLNFSRCRVAISLDKTLKEMDDQNSSTAIAMGFMNEIKEDEFSVRLLEGAIDESSKDLIYRVDKLEKKSTIVDIERMVLVRLLAREDWRCDRVRQLILDPNFLPEHNKKLQYFVMTAGFDEISSLDASQHELAVEAISTDNYYIITEKEEPKKSEMSTIVSVLAQVILNLDKTILIVAQNIDDLIPLLKLLQNKRLRFNLIDDGKSMKARYQFQSNLVKVPQQAEVDLTKRFDAYIRQLDTAPIVVSTYAMSIGGLQFTRRTFDYCIAFDCDTTELLTGLAPMFCSDKHIIIDIRDDQTPPSSLQDSANLSLGDHLRQVRS